MYIYSKVTYPAANIPPANIHANKKDIYDYENIDNKNSTTLISLRSINPY